MESAVKTAAAWNKILMNHCSLCTVYCDKQVQYETWSGDQYRLSNATVGQLFQCPGGKGVAGSEHGGGSSEPPSQRVEEVKQCQSFLFDEDSVILSVNSRQEGEEGDALIPPSG